MKESIKKRGRVITGWRHVEPPKGKRPLRKVSPAPVPKVAPEARAPVTEPLAEE